MKKRKIIGAAAAFAAAATLGSCGIFEAPSNTAAPTLYGPPPEYETYVDVTSDTPEKNAKSSQDISSENDNKDFSPEDNIIPTLYGPPEVFAISEDAR